MSGSTASGKSSQIEKSLGISVMDSWWFLSSKIAENPMAWTIVVNGLLVDAREAPLYAQEEAFRLGLIPYVPSKGSDGD